MQHESILILLSLSAYPSSSPKAHLFPFILCFGFSLEPFDYNSNAIIFGAYIVQLRFYVHFYYLKKIRIRLSGVDSKAMRRDGIWFNTIFVRGESTMSCDGKCYTEDYSLYTKYHWATCNCITPTSSHFRRALVALCFFFFCSFQFD